MPRHPSFTDTERAVYELVCAGILTPAHAIMFRGPLLSLEAKGFLSQPRPGEWAPTDQLPEVPENMINLSIKIPASHSRAIDAMGEDRSESGRRVVKAGLEALGLLDAPAPRVAAPPRVSRRTPKK